MVTQSTALDVASENVANADTVGYRADRPVFRQILSQAGAADPASRSLRYAVARSVQPDFQTGELKETGNPLDVAITDDRSFFAVRGRDGDRYTRAGKFTLGQDGTLFTPDGYAVLGSNGVPIQVPPGTNATIDATGQVLLNGEASGQQLMVVTFPNVQGLLKEGAALLRARPESGAPIISDSQVRVGALEMSNADPIKGMTGLVTATRHFEMLARVIDAFSQIEHKAATDIAKR
jgi:flagellar basal body rod protein FlgG